jgi:hypothetical protein
MWDWFNKNKTAFFVLGIVLATIAVLFFMGRSFFCECNVISLWSGDVNSNQNSQQLFDLYTFTHLIHGALFYLFLKLLFPKSSFATRLLAAVFIESAWEIIENTPMIINKYRTATISLDYYGDSILNSVGDIIAMIVAFVAVKKLPVWASIVGVIAIELILLFLIRDNLSLNIIMLVYPIDAIRIWQAGG